MEIKCRWNTGDYDTSRSGDNLPSNEGRYLGRYNGSGADGYGKLISDSYTYEGYWKDAYAHGSGTLTFKSGNIYKCSFEGGRIHGKGKVRCQNGSLYEGDLNEDLRRHGNGSMTYINGDKYTGEFFNGEFHLIGRYLSKDNESYEGLWKEGKYHGEGFLYYGSKVKKGTWKNGEFQSFLFIHNN
jgi:hypothetical protein